VNTTRSSYGLLPGKTVATGLALGLVVLCALMVLTPISPLAHRALLLLLWAPVVEELILRWGLQEALLRAWPGGAVCVTLGCALLFAAAHVVTRNVAWWPLYCVPGVVLAALYTWRRSLVLCLVAHATMNGLYLGVTVMQP
jgi:uncharacterized protein